MSKISIDKNVFIPMPMTILGVEYEGKPNYMAVGWVTRINSNPPMIAIGVGNHRFSNKGLSGSKTFSINFPGKDLAIESDYVGIVSGQKVDKSRVFDMFYGEFPNIPMIKECKLNLACKIVHTHQLPSNLLIIGEIIEAIADDEIISDGAVDYKKMDALILTMPDNNYSIIGESIAKAWSIGKQYYSK